jgi:hypothetical protein
MNNAPTMTDTRSIYSRSPVKANFPLLILLSASLFFGSSCGLVHNLFGQKSGCPSNGKNVGAERILSGEKVPKASKFKA